MKVVGKPSIFQAIQSLMPDASFYVENDCFEGICWDDERDQPSRSDIEAKIKELQSDYDAKKYQRDRAVAYPSIQDQLDMLYHQGIDGWKAEIKKVKDAHPKPE